MAARGTRALAAQAEQVEDSEYIVTSALAYPVWCSLPDVSSNGATTTVKYGEIKSFRANSTGSIEVVDHMGRRVCIVPPFGNLVIKAQNNDSEALPSWEVFGPGYNEGGVKGVHIADFTAADGTATAQGSAFSALYDQDDVNGEVDALLDTTTDELIANVTIDFLTVEQKFNNALAQLDLMGLTGGIDATEGTTELALSATSSTVLWQLVDDDERLVTNANAHPVYCTLPDIVAGGAGALVRLNHDILFVNTGGGPIIVRDFQHRHVCVVPDERAVVIKAVLAASTSGYQWIVTDRDTSSRALTTSRVATIAPLLITLPTVAAAACDLAASFTDLDWETEIDVVVDAQIDLLDTATAAAFAEIETAFNAYLVALETITNLAAS